MAKKKSLKAKKAETKTIKAEMEFRRILTSGGIGFNIKNNKITYGKYVVFTRFLPKGFNLTEHKITGSVTYKINVEKIAT